MIFTLHNHWKSQCDNVYKVPGTEWVLTKVRHLPGPSLSSFLGQPHTWGPHPLHAVIPASWCCVVFRMGQVFELSTATRIAHNEPL